MKEWKKEIKAVILEAYIVGRRSCIKLEDSDVLPSYFIMNYFNNDYLTPAIFY